MSQAQVMATATWYFDFISPYSYFGLHTLPRLPSGTQVLLRPVLFAGLLKHWGQKGPAEIPAKRVWTYRSCVWWAQQNAIPFRMPATHPFNPLSYLRLSIAAGNDLQAIRTIFTRLWATGVDPADPTVLEGLMNTLRVAPEQLSAPFVKEALRAYTDEAIARGVFGVPSLWAADQIFWGSDSVDFAAACMQDPQLLTTGEFARADETPVGVMR
jgi:2-hydroxychromene-2-carboxylate isomerase